MGKNKKKTKPTTTDAVEESPYNPFASDHEEHKEETQQLPHDLQDSEQVDQTDKADNSYATHDDGETGLSESEPSRLLTPQKAAINPLAVVKETETLTIQEPTQALENLPLENNTPFEGASSPVADQSKLNSTFNLDDDDILNNSMLSYGSSLLKQFTDESQILDQLALYQKKIKDLQADKIKLKALLRKAKDAIESTASKHKQCQEQVKL